jgi:hypothetical protein
MAPGLDISACSWGTWRSSTHVDKVEKAELGVAEGKIEESRWRWMNDRIPSPSTCARDESELQDS